MIHKKKIIKIALRVKITFICYKFLPLSLENPKKKILLQNLLNIFIYLRNNFFAHFLNIFENKIYKEITEISSLWFPKHWNKIIKTNISTAFCLMNTKLIKEDLICIFIRVCTTDLLDSFVAILEINIDFLKIRRNTWNSKKRIMF